MTDFDKTNTFTLGKVDKDKPENAERDTEKWPDYKGTLNVDGVEYYLSAWVKTNGQTGEKFFSGAIQVAEKKTAAPATPASGGGMDGFEDDIPF